MNEQGDGALARVVALETDLFFAVKIRDTLRRAGYETRIVRTVESLGEILADGEYGVALVNTAARGIDWQAGIRVARGVGVPVVAYGPHVDIEAQDAARVAGAARVIANSRLGDLPTLIARVIARISSSQAQSAVSGEDYPPDDDGDI
jgi:hypothetical protein